jgi:transcriptional regulator with XRE-family HTH domain
MRPIRSSTKRPSSRNTRRTSFVDSTTNSQQTVNRASQNRPTRPFSEFDPYNALVPRKPNPAKGSRPAQGAHLLALREAAALTQIDLAQALGVARANIALWEWSDKPPRAEHLPKLAEILGVRLEDLILRKKPSAIAARPGPVGEVQKAFEEVRKLPRSQQRKIIETVHALVNEYKRSVAG